MSRYACDRPTKLLRLDYVAQQGEYFAIRPQQKYTDASFVIRQTASYPIVGPRTHATYFRNSLLALYPPKDRRDVQFIVGILNSTLIRYIYQQRVQESKQKAFPQVKVISLRELPIRSINFDDPADKSRHDTMVSLVERMLTLNRELPGKTGQARAVTERQIAATDGQIDRLVYALYGLTEAEIKVVEGAAG